MEDKMNLESFQEESKADNNQDPEKDSHLLKSLYSTKRTYSDLMNFVERKKDLPNVTEDFNEKEGFPKYLGSSIIKGYALKNFNSSHLKDGDELYLKREKKVLADEKKNNKLKKQNSNKGFNDNIIRILSKNNEVDKFNSIF